MSVLSKIKIYLKANYRLYKFALNVYNWVQVKSNISGNNNVIVYDKARLKNCRIKIHGNNNKVIIGAETYLDDVDFIIYGNNHKCIIGEHVYAKKSIFWFEDEKGEITIGERTSIHGAQFSTVESVKVVLGNDCLLSFGIDIRPTDSHSILDINTKNRINPSRNIIIGNHVWIGANVTILKNVILGDDIIVGTRALVTKSFINSHVAIAGNPAKIVKTDITWNKNRI